MSTVYLHIGTPKTGTTSIQRLLAQNRKVLEAHQIAFPDYGFRYKDALEIRNGHFLVRMGKQADESGNVFQHARDYEKGLAFLEKTAQQFDKIILTDEKIWNGSRQIADFWPMLKKDLDERNISLRIIVYLRRQDLLVQSLYAHNIRRSNISCSFSEYLEEALARENAFCLDYNAGLQELFALFGRESLLVRIYEESQFRGTEGNLFSDFLDIFGLQMSDGFQMEQTQYNVRMTKSHLELRRILNHIPLPVGYEPLRSLWAVQNIHLPEDSDEKYSLFEPEAQRRFLERYEEGNHCLARTYFGYEDGVLFKEPMQEDPQFHVGDHELLTHTVLAYGKALNTLAKNNEELRKELEKLQNEVQSIRRNTIWKRLKRKAGSLVNAGTK